VSSAAPIVGIVGVGFQGAGLAQRLALGGLEVRLHDPRPEAVTAAIEGTRSRRARTRLRAVDALEDLSEAALIIENVPERLELKRRVFAALAAAAPGAVLASNSSALVPDAIAADLDPERDAPRLLNLHFLGPQYGHDAVELVRGRATRPDCADRARAILVSAGLDPIEVGAGVGFVYNRVAAAGLAALARCVDLGLLTPETFLRHALPGPRPRQLDVLDHIGLDVVVAVQRSCHAAFGARFAPTELLEAPVREGRLGVKTGRGLLDHRDGPVVGRELPLPAARRPRSPILDVAVRGARAELALLLSALAGRPERRIRIDDDRWLAALEPRLAAELAPRLERAPLDGAELLIDATIAPEDAQAARLDALDRTAPRLVVCAPIGRRAALAAVRPDVELVHVQPGLAGVERVTDDDAPDGGPLEALWLEAMGRILPCRDGPVRPGAALHAAREREAARVVAERLAEPGTVDRLLGEPLVARGAARPASERRAIHDALDAFFGDPP
jgi:3-hydroxybutyryl-CoA dehydrogenase